MKRRGNVTESTLRRSIARRSANIAGRNLSIEQKEALALGQKTLMCQRLPSGVGCRELQRRPVGRLPK